MLTKDRIKKIIDELRDFERILEKRYRYLKTDESFEDLMLYKKKIDSWKRLYEIAPNPPRIRQRQKAKMFEPSAEKTLAEILAGARLPEGVR